jgi:hypothetical protein
VSIKNCETYTPAKGKNKQALKTKTVSACCMDVKHNNVIYFFLQKKKKILNKAQNRKIMTELIKNITRPLHSQYN